MEGCADWQSAGLAAHGSYLFSFGVHGQHGFRNKSFERQALVKQPSEVAVALADPKLRARAGVGHGWS